MLVASKGMHDSFSAANIFCCTIMLLLKNFTDYHHIQSLWTLNASLRQDKTQVFSKSKQIFSLILQEWFPQDWWSFWKENMDRECSASAHALLLTLSSMCSTSSAGALPQREMPIPELILQKQNPLLSGKKKTNPHLFHFLHANCAL